jgi:hypothetical protein
LLLTALVSGLVVYVLFRLAYSDLPPLPSTAALSTALLAAAVAFAAPSVRGRLAGRPGTKPILPMVVARMAALAKACSALGALLVGAWGGVGVYLAPRLEAATPRRDAVTAGLGFIAALALVAAALWLENVCRVKNPPEADPAPTEPGP